jgi:hypothetical protein
MRRGSEEEEEEEMKESSVIMLAIEERSLLKNEEEEKKLSTLAFLHLSNLLLQFLGQIIISYPPSPLYIFDKQKK